jgi:hypothetical protein
MICAQGGIFGWVTHSSELLTSLIREKPGAALVDAT